MAIYEATSGIMLTYEYSREGLNINYRDSTKSKYNILRILNITSSNQIVGFLWNKDTLVFRRIEDNRFTMDDITKGDENSYLLFNQDLIKREREFAKKFGNIDTTHMGYGLFHLKNESSEDTIEIIQN